MLSSSELSLSEIAQEIGYTDQSYFGKVFKKQTGYSPHTYRNRAKRRGETL
ncbi:MAG: AraC family transcriptional regulator [Hungatella hathewayi]|nr:AraC family transcriptional regulator [Hungatella hathewayi]